MPPLNQLDPWLKNYASLRAVGAGSLPSDMDGIASALSH